MHGQLCPSYAAPEQDLGRIWHGKVWKEVAFCGHTNSSVLVALGVSQPGAYESVDPLVSVSTRPGSSLRYFLLGFQTLCSGRD